MDIAQLNLELERTKAKVFIGNNTAFYGCLLCIINFEWKNTEDNPTASTNGETIFINPDFFMRLHSESRITLLLHEMMHIARLHELRRGNREHKLWNIACDFRINNDLDRDGYSFNGLDFGCLNQDIDRNGILSEEEIYLLLENKSLKIPELSLGESEDLLEPSEKQKANTVNIVAQALEQAKTNKASSGTGDIQDIFNKFMKPIVPWQSLLMKFFKDLGEENRSYARPNRRYEDFYLPSTVKDEDRLEHLAYFIDVSGSVSDEDVDRCNSEIKYIKEVLNPKKLTLLLFDDEITKTFVYDESDPFEALVVVGRGGTSLEPVKKWIDKNQPTAAIIFSDLYCEPMEKLKYNTPVIWIAVNTDQTYVPFGKIIHIDT